MCEDRKRPKCFSPCVQRCDYRMNFDKHISNLRKKAARQINVLCRIGKYLPINWRKVIYQAFILSAFNFCPVIWHFCSEANNKKLEKLNYRALRHVSQGGHGCHGPPKLLVNVFFLQRIDVVTSFESKIDKNLPELR